MTQLLEAAQKTKKKAAIAAPNKEKNNVEGHWHGSCQNVRLAAVAADDHDHVSPRPNEGVVSCNDTEQLLQEMEAGRCPEWKNIVHRSSCIKLLDLLEVASVEGRRAEAPLGVGG